MATSGEGVTKSFECTECDEMVSNHRTSHCGHNFCIKCWDNLTKATRRCPIPDCKKPLKDIPKPIDVERVLQRPDLIHRNNVVEILQELNYNLSKLSADVIRIDENLTDFKTEVYNEIKIIEAKMDNKLSEMKDEIDKKMFQWNTKITKLEQTTDENKWMIEFNQLTECSNFEQKLNLESFILLRNPQMDCFSVADNRGNFQPDFTWKISGIKNKLKQTTLVTKSEVFKWSGYPVRAQAKLEIKRDGITYMSLCLEEHNKGKALDIKLNPTVYYVLRDQIGISSYFKHKIRSNKYLFTTKFSHSHPFAQPFVEKFCLLDPLYNVDDSIVLDIYVEPPLMTQFVSSYNGTLNWAIGNYQNKKKMAKKEMVWIHESPYFYTQPRGYRVQLRMWLNGFGDYKGKGMTAELCFLPGEYDDDLFLSFPHRTTITLLNRNDPQRNVIKIVDKDIKTQQYYSIDLCSSEEIDNILISDTLFYKISITPSNKQY